MDASDREVIAERLHTSRDHNAQMLALMPSAAPATLRETFAMCAIDLALEHHSGFVRVVEAGEYGTGAALLRPILEASAAAFWLVYAASCADIAKLPTVPADSPQNDIPDLTTMGKALQPIFPDIAGLIAGFKPGGTSKWLHKYTHGGAPQLVRRTGEGWAQHSVLLNIIRADMFADLSACLATVVHPNQSLAEYAFSKRDALGQELIDRGFRAEPIPQQPHRLPDAPLLAQGCGNPF